MWRVGRRAAEAHAADGEAGRGRSCPTAPHALLYPLKRREHDDEVEGEGYELADLRVWVSPISKSGGGTTVRTKSTRMYVAGTVATVKTVIMAMFAMA